ncbi:MAG: PAS domain S-box protein [Rhodospirillaceae bacterium]|nr:PAS domain S-box protein [Rhodospirillales bacterium]
MSWRRWIEDSFGRRIATQAVVSILFASLLLCIIAFAGSLWLLRQQDERDLASRLANTSQRLAARMEVFVRSAADLAGNPVMTTALLDSHQRDTYLKPFLGNYRLPVTEPHAIALCDFNGQFLAGRKGSPPRCYPDLPQVAALFASETAKTALVAMDGTPWLLTFQPVFYPGTGHAEGYVAAALDIRSVLGNFAAEANDALRLTSQDGTIQIAAGTVAGPSTASAEGELSLNEVAGNFRLTLTKERSAPEGLGTLMAAYALAVAAAVLLAWVLAQRMAQKLTSPLAALQRSRDELENQVTDRTLALNQALAEIQSSEERYRSLFARSQVVMLLVDAEAGIIVDANQAAASYYGWNIKTLKGMGISQINIAAPDEIAAEMTRAREEQRNHFFFQHRLSDGEIRNVEVHSGPVEQNGKLLLLSFVHDVTDRIRLERERQILVTAIEQSPVSIVITKPDGAIDYVNEAFVRVTGYSREEAIGQNPRILKSGTTPDEEYRAIWEQLTRGEPWTGLFHNKRKDGTLYWEQARIFPIVDKSGEITHYVGIKENITEQKQAEEVIQTLNRRYHGVLSAASEVAIIATDYNGVITVFNSGAEKMLGYTAEEMIGHHTPAYFHLNDEIIARKYELEAELGRPMDGFSLFIVRAELDGSEKREWTYVRKDGKHITVSLVVTPVNSDSGERPGYLGVAVDISDRKAAEQKLVHSEERFRTLVEETTDWMWETDKNHAFSWFSPSFSHVLNVSSSAMIGKRRWDVASEHHEIDTAIWQAHMEDLSAHRSFRDFRYWLRNVGGEGKWISTSGSPRFGESGEFLGYRGSGTDVSSEAASALRLKMLSTVVEQSPVSVVITDTSGIIEYVNAHFTRLTGYTAEEAVGRGVNMLGSGQTPDAVYKDLWTTITAGKPWGGELKNKKKNGEFHWEVVAISPIVNDEHEVVHYVAIKEDITFRKEAQARISEANRALEQQTQQLQAVNAELEQFAYVASHDLRQPLRMISSYLALIERRLGPAMTEELQAFFGFATGGAKRMDRLILDLLDYSRTGRRTNPLEPVALSEAVADSMANLEVAIDEAGASVTTAEDMPVVSGDRMELVRLFQNLIGNAIKYRAPERQPMVELGWRFEAGHWTIWVRDNGIGIAPEDRERAFLIFQRLVAQEAYEGTGIGLAVCRKIVENHGGRIWIEDGLDGGTSVCFSLPKAGETKAGETKAGGK